MCFFIVLFRAVSVMDQANLCHRFQLALMIVHLADYQLILLLSVEATSQLATCPQDHDLEAGF